MAFRLTLGLMAAFVLPCSSQIQSRGVTRVERGRIQSFERESRRALLIGVGKYPEAGGFSTLRYPAKDAGVLAAELDHQGYTVRSIINEEATRGIVRKALADMADQTTSGEGTFVFYFAGHGYEQDGANYLAVYGAVSDDLKGEGLSLDEVLRLIARIPARQKVLFIDACRNNPVVGRAAQGPRSFSRLAESEGVKILYSTGPGGTSYEDDDLQEGVFTYFLLHGLQGEAAGKDGLITFQDLADYVTESLQEFGLKKGRSQVPFQSGESRGEFLLGKIGAARQNAAPGTNSSGYLETAEANAKAGLEFAAKGQYREAVEAFTKAMDARQPVAEELYYRALAYGHLREFRRAAEDLSKALDLGGESAVVYANRGFAYSELKDYDQAIHDFTRAIDLKPDYTAALVSRGMAYTSTLKLSEALADLNRAIEMQPSLPAAWRARGKTFIAQKDFQAAVRDFSRAIELDPDLASVWVDRANAYSSLNDPEKALSDLTQALGHQPDYAPALAARAQIYTAQGQFQQAIEDYSGVLKLQPEEATAYANRGYAYGALGQYALAIQDCNRAIELDPGLAEAYNNRGLAYARQKDYRRALTDYNRAIELKPEYATAYANRAEVRRVLGDKAGAKSDSEKARALDATRLKIAI